MAKKKRGRSRKNNGPKIPLTIAFPLLYSGSTIWNDYKARGSQFATTRALMYWTGYNQDVGEWRWQDMKKGALPLFYGLMAHKVFNYLGVNRALGRAKLPIIRI